PSRSPIIRRASRSPFLAAQRQFHSKLCTIASSPLPGFGGVLGSHQGGARLAVWPTNSSQTRVISLPVFFTGSATASLFISRRCLTNCNDSSVVARQRLETPVLARRLFNNNFKVVIFHQLGPFT